MLYHLVVHAPRNINGFWAVCDLSKASVSYVLCDARARPPLCAQCARSREGDRARYHSVTQLKAGAFQMFHCVYRVTERPRAPRIVPNRPRGCSLCLGAHGRFGLLVLQISATRREALCAPPWAVWDDPRLSGHLHGALRTLVVQDYDKRGPQSPKFILTDF